MSLSITAKSHQPEESLDLMLFLVNRHFSRIQSVLETTLPLMLRDHQDTSLFLKSFLLHTALSGRVIEKSILNPVAANLQQYGCRKPNVYARQVEQAVLDADYSLLTEFQVENDSSNKVRWEPHHLSLSAWEDSVSALFKQYERDERFDQNGASGSLRILDPVTNGDLPGNSENLRLRIKYFLFDIKIRLRTVLTYAVLAAAANMPPAKLAEEKKSA